MINNALLHLAVRIHPLRDQCAERDRGATMVEYGLLIAVVALVIGLGAATFGTDVSTWFVGKATTVTSK